MAQSITNQIERLLVEHPELARWSDALSEVLHQLRERTSSMCEVFADELMNDMTLILASLPRVASTHDELQDVTGAISTLDVRFLSKRFGVTFGMGLDMRLRSFYLCAEMLKPAQLWRAPAEFWEQMASLSRYCDDVTYEPCVAAPKPEDGMAVRHLQRSKCAVFRMIADYTLLKAQEAMPEPDCGGVTVYWSWGTEIEPLLTGAAECFARLSRMNWLLHRLNYGDAHARRAKARKA
jgi:hypothetical protein